MKVLYFASIRHAIGCGEETIEPPAQVRTVGDLADWLSERDDARAAALADRERLKAAVNEELASFDTPVSAGDTVAFFPPVTGG
jgi:molybdopterin synthase sulfur carrier subunit